MKKQTAVISFLTILCFILVVWVPSQADDTVYVCKNSKTGAPRLVKASNQCKKTEYLVTLYGGTGGGGQTGQLACVTGLMRNPTTTSADIMITNAQNVTISGWSDVFNPIYVQQNPDSPGDIYWGLQCKAGWLNTGCNHSVEGSEPKDVDLQQYSNGCFSDDEEISYLNMFVTCCKIL
jgi:hypothetical protein